MRVSGGFVTVPAGLPSYRIVNARIPGCLVDAERLGPGGELVDCDLVVEGGRIAAILPAGGDSHGGRAVDLDRGIVLPRLVDIHTHLDKGHIWPRRPNPDGTAVQARLNVAADREASWSAEDVQRRMDFALRCAYAQGTGAIRTHIDSMGRQTAISWPVFAHMREAWKGRIVLQAVALYPVMLATGDEPQFRHIVETVARHGGILGGITFLGEVPGPRLAAALDRVFAAAAAHGLDLDFHVDESDSSDARTLRLIAEAALRHRFAGRIVAGHCCSLALYDEKECAETIARVAEASIAVVSLPMCNLYLQDRHAARTPRWRGVAPLHELAAAGVSVMLASDNTRDPFYAYGDLDPLEVFREATRIAHLDHSQVPWIEAISATPARIMRLPGSGRIATGAPADLILTRARGFNELLARPQSDRVVIVAGRQVETQLPDYRELDDLMIEEVVERAPAVRPGDRARTASRPATAR
jgi:cytosine deaminase